ncbi:GCN5-related N-acetyltransferase [Kribbella flavida DSM 17836]|uniref:GCN5-related N-acetyltransferase n=1 Tax=Kribbella flavida (strain DSM 17836 / JCM 10339 / NBRC 14399) TaxID=479435 RepID=D2PSF7_KRIFD|nr:GNAT family N-acetyltransferase [Kribbella flavida]ADB33095.1 GCN5-related N-acetyltransferase [Kribbella flavida DSM 17836]
MPELIEPTVELRTSWLESAAEWGGKYQEGTGMHEAGDDLATVEGFRTWVERLRELGDDSRELDRPHATCRWIVEDGNYLGAVTLLHTLTDKLLDGGGHIGYSVRPSARGRGLATWALGQILEVAREREMDRVLITCDEDNLASAKAIERNGGVLENIRETWLGPTRRYWITLGTSRGGSRSPAVHPQD